MNFSWNTNDAHASVKDEVLSKKFDMIAHSKVKNNPARVSRIPKERFKKYAVQCAI